jgi:hypothetical protein
MLSDFIAEHRDALIVRCAAMVAQRPHRDATPDQLRNGIPLFLGQLYETLQADGSGRALESLRLSGGPGGEHSDVSAIGSGAGDHGRQLSVLGYTVDQVVHDYGDLCQVITALALEEQASISVEEFSTLNRCLDNAIAVAVAAFAGQQTMTQLEGAAALDSMQLHELKNCLATASYAATALELGNLPISGATGSILKRSLAAMRAHLGGTDAQ